MNYHSIAPQISIRQRNSQTQISDLFKVTTAEFKQKKVSIIVTTNAKHTRRYIKSHWFCSTSIQHFYTFFFFDFAIFLLSLSSLIGAFKKKNHIGPFKQRKTEINYLIVG